ncbi:MAG: serine--tRNA ligase [Elusimicrobiota bacterium]
MIDIKLIRENYDMVKQNVLNRGGRYIPTLEQIVELDSTRREVLLKLEALQAEVNKSSAEIPKLKKEKRDAEVKTIVEANQKRKEEVKGFKDTLDKIEADLLLQTQSLPNLCDASIPIGKNETENKEVRQVGTPRAIDFPAKDHTTLGEKLDILDFARAAKLSGSRFVALKGQGARLERALINFMLDVHTQQHGYTEIFPPFLVTEQTMTGTGQLPKFREELYQCGAAEDNAFLIPTAEVPLTNMHRDEVFDDTMLPKYYTAYTACFRREAGSYGKDTRGLIRNHQFNKIELVKLCMPEQSIAELESLTANAGKILELLGLPYRVIELCTGDIGFSSARTYDLEVWMPGEDGGKGKWREISSCSNCTDFQARRINIKYKTKDGKRGFVHTLNGSGVAVGRTFAAILENYQQPDGSIVIPEALRPYCGFDKIG